MCFTHTSQNAALNERYSRSLFIAHTSSSECLTKKPLIYAIKGFSCFDVSGVYGQASHEGHAPVVCVLYTLAPATAMDPRIAIAIMILDSFIQPPGLLVSTGKIL